MCLGGIVSRSVARFVDSADQDGDEGRQAEVGMEAMLDIRNRFQVVRHREHDASFGCRHSQSVTPE